MGLREAKVNRVRYHLGGGRAGFGFPLGRHKGLGTRYRRVYLGFSRAFFTASAMFREAVFGAGLRGGAVGLRYVCVGSLASDRGFGRGPAFVERCLCCVGASFAFGVCEGENACHGGFNARRQGIHSEHGSPFGLSCEARIFEQCGEHFGFFGAEFFGLFLLLA